MLTQLIGIITLVEGKDLNLFSFSVLVIEPVIAPLAGGGAHPSISYIKELVATIGITLKSSDESIVTV